MKIEILQNNEGYIYLEKDEIYNLKYPIISKETLGNLNIYSVKDLIFNHEKETQSPYLFKCKHNKDIYYKSMNLLPSEDWQELIECWSCHNNEFASVKDLKIKVRPKGILVSLFFILINNKDLPDCCRNKHDKDDVKDELIKKDDFKDELIEKDDFKNELNKNDDFKDELIENDDFKNELNEKDDFKDEVRKMWFNELGNVNHKQKVFEYLNTHFKSNSLFIFNYKSKTYEIKYFYTCKSVIIENEKYSFALKIGIKEKPDFYYKPTKSEFINDFYLELIYKQIHLLGIEIFDYKMGFILFN